MVDGSKATLRRLELVMPYMLRWGDIFGFRHGLEGTLISSYNGK